MWRWLPVLVAALALAGCMGDDADEEGTTTGGTETGAVDGGGGGPAVLTWVECENEAEGFAISYPEDWHTDALTPEQECSFFDPEPFELVEGSEFPATALEARFFDHRPFDEVVQSLTDPTFARVVLQEETSEPGFPTVRFETEATGAGLMDAGTLSYGYVVDAAGEGFVVRTSVPEGGDLASARTIVDAAVRSLRFSSESEELADPQAAQLPQPVGRTRRAIMAALDAGDFETLEALIPADGFTYTYGQPHPDGPVAYWLRLERSGEDRPFTIMRELLELPFTQVEDLYVWPFAYDRDPAGLTEEELDRLAAAGAATREQLEQMAQAGNYLGWRMGIAADGTWRFFVAGD
ncbi:MAG TPA: hypothetical protein VD704_03535 [Gaiellaceae bacterium]|nr:hypothetical protein [Gaiellaceae bacterium]